MDSGGGVSLSDLQDLLQESEVQVQIDATSTASATSGTSASPRSRSPRPTQQNLFTWVKPPGGDFTYVPQGELTGVQPC